jgi:hypothetical protein
MTNPFEDPDGTVRCKNRCNFTTPSISMHVSARALVMSPNFITAPEPQSFAYG